MEKIGNILFLICVWLSGVLSDKAVECALAVRTLREALCPRYWGLDFTAYLKTTRMPSEPRNHIMDAEFLGLKDKQK